MANVAKAPRIIELIGIALAILAAGCLLVVAGLQRFGSYMSEGVIETETLQGNVLVALRDDSEVTKSLLLGCHAKGSLPSSVLMLLADGQLAEIPSGTKMHMEYHTGGPLETVTVTDGRLKGRQVWVCHGQFAMVHPWP